jgi:Lon protease-like protein
MPFRADAEDEACLLDRPKLLAALAPYFRQNGITVSWKALEGTPDDRLVISLCMICPFSASEKQALLEVPTLAERAGMMISLIEMAACEQPGREHVRH